MDERTALASALGSLSDTPSRCEMFFRLAELRVGACCVRSSVVMASTKSQLRRLFGS